VEKDLGTENGEYLLHSDSLDFLGGCIELDEFVRFVFVGIDIPFLRVL